jgi:TPR repeat protein
MWRVAALVLIVAVNGGSVVAAAEEAQPESSGRGYLDGLIAFVSPVTNGVAAIRDSARPVVTRTTGTVDALIGDAYYYGHWVSRDYSEAARWYRRAAAAGNSQAQATLGDMYYYGRNLPQDFVAAVHWWQLAADQGVAMAQLNLSVMYANGDGIERDYVKAHMYANLAVARLPPGEDHDIALKNRETIAQAMTREQVAEAQRLAREWRPVSSAVAEQRP